MGENKRSSICKKLNILGADVDLESRTISGRRKLKELRDQMLTNLDVTTWTLPFLERLHGKLEFISIAVPAGHCFVFFLTQA